MEIEVIRDTGGGHHFRVVASNGRVLCHSEQYTTRRAAVHAARLVIEQAGAAELVFPGDAILVLS